jgi:hypothetical protein
MKMERVAEGKRIKKRIAVAVLTVALLISMVGMASADINIYWCLDSSQGAAAGLYTMWKVVVPPGGIPLGNVPISAGESEIWTANDAAACDVGFPAITWGGNIKRVETTDDQNFTAYIGYYDGEFHSAGNSTEITIENFEKPY